MNQSVGIIQSVEYIAPSVGGVSTKYLPEVVVDNYGPPLRNDRSPIVVDFSNGYPRNSTDERGGLVLEGIEINVETRGIPREFTQVGILKPKRKHENHNHPNHILSLFGRQLMTSGDKWQYYTLSNMGIMPTRLPIQVIQNGRNKDAMYEYGVDRLYSDDTIVVDGYDDEYIVQIYEARQYRYIG